MKKIDHLDRSSVDDVEIYDGKFLLRFAKEIAESFLKDNDAFNKWESDDSIEHIREMILESGDSVLEPSRITIYNKFMIKK